MPDPTNQSSDVALLEWEFDEYDHYERGKWWYIIAGAIALGLLIYAIVSVNFLFALVIIMGAVLLYVKTIIQPKRVRFALTKSGVVIGSTAYSFRDIKVFWFCYHPPQVRKLFLDFQGLIRPTISIGLEEQDPNQVRKILGLFVREDVDRDQEPTSELLSRILRI